MSTRGNVIGPTLAAVLGCLTLLGCAAVLEELGNVVSTEQSTPQDGLREALIVGTERAVEALGRVDGYLADEALRIEIPPRLETVAQAVRAVGAGDKVDEFLTSMNRAAETAAPQARAVFVDVVREMTFQDAMKILQGSDHEATDYLRANAGPRLAELFRPVVESKLDEVGATRSFNRWMDEVSRLPLISRPVFDLGQYVTEESLDGLFLAIGREERRIREDPVARTTELLRRWFGESR